MSTQPTVLVVEDSKVQAETLRRFLQGHGFSVMLAEDGGSALHQLQSGVRPEIVISDITMPEMTGYELCAKIKGVAELATIPVLLLTVLSDPKDVVQGLNCGADSYVTKPYNEELLLSRIAALCARPPELRSAVEGEKASIKIGHETFTVRAGFRQALDLLVSTYENAVDQNKQLQIANEKLLLQKKELEELVDIKNKFLGMAAHDLRNPLYAIHGYATHLVKGLTQGAASRQRDMCEGIVRLSDFMAKLVDDLLTVVSHESGQVQLSVSQINILEPIIHQVELHRVLAEEKSIEILFEPGNDPIEVRCDENKVTQVVSNLVSNAIKYSHSETTVTVECCIKGSVVQVVVKDQGQGIPQAELEKLFQPFSRTSVTPTGGERSTGLGLAICKNIIDAHGGEITVDSHVGEGSVFAFTLPL